MNKKLFLFLLLGIIVNILMIGCSSVQGFDGGVTFEIPEEFVEHLQYQGQLPTRKFAYDGVLNVSTGSTSSVYYYGQNDYYQFSEAFKKHLEEFGDNYLITESIKQERETTHAKFGKDQLPIDDQEVGSREEMMVAWDQTGARFSYSYRKFHSLGQLYYIYTYNAPITSTLEIPFMVIKDPQNSRTNKLILLNLPYDTIYQVNINLKINKMIKENTYLDQKFYQFTYPNYLSKLTHQERIQEIKNWYQTYTQVIDGEQFGFEYLGNQFTITFEQSYFLISYQGVSHVN